MTRPLTHLLLSVAVLGLMACGGGGGGSMTTDPEMNDDDMADEGGSPPPVIATGTNGLVFGEAGQSLADAEAVEVAARSVGFVNGSDAEVTTALVTLDAGFLDAVTTGRSGTVQIRDETVTITNGVGTLSTGETVIATFEPDRAGTYAGALDVSVVGTSSGENAFVFGFETDPDIIADRQTGTLEYVGGFQAFGFLNGVDNRSVEYEGDITIAVDFSGVGSADVTLNGQLDGRTEADLSGALAIAGNGFSGDLACTSGCTGGVSSIDAGFFGPDADEVAGVLGLGFTADGDEFDGAGSFVLTDPVAR